MDKAVLFIDGTNLYASQYELFGPSEYLYFPYFLKQIESKLHVSFDHIYFYASYSHRPKHPINKEKLYLKNEYYFYRSVKSLPGLSFFKGYRSPTSGKEKEVDVKLSVDIVDFAHLKKYQEVFLLTGDADFMEALKIPNRLGIKTAVLCMENKIMFKALLFYKTFVMKFTDKIIKFNKIRKKPIYLKLDKAKVKRSCY
ncbi:MAG: NYN domain-containing protein [Ignavibacteriales bacterium]|nr:MAG: NYN domain-containing protein [Ignavibacteriales bacterium]